MVTVPVHKVLLRVELVLADRHRLEELMTAYEDRITITVEERTIKRTYFRRVPRLSVAYLLESNNKDALRELKSDLAYLTLIMGSPTRALRLPPKGK